MAASALECSVSHGAGGYSRQEASTDDGPAAQSACEQSPHEQPGSGADCNVPPCEARWRAARAARAVHARRGGGCGRLGCPGSEDTRQAEDTDLQRDQRPRDRSDGHADEGAEAASFLR